MRARRGSCSSDGGQGTPCRYVLVYRTFALARVFVGREPVALVSAQFLRAASEDRCEILTYCFMPDHVLMLVEARDDASDGKAFAARAKEYSGFRYSIRTGRTLWQRDSFERVLRGAERSRAMSRHILANPVRAGLAARPLEYPYSGSFAWDRQAALETAEA